MKKKIIMIFITCLCMCVLAGCNKGSQDNNDETTGEYLAVVQVRLDAAVNLYIGRLNTVVAVEYVNDEAKSAYSGLENEIKRRNYSSGLKLLLGTAIDKQYITDGGKIVFDVIDTSADKNVDVNDILVVARGAARSVFKEKDVDVDIETLVYNMQYVIKETEKTEETEEETVPRETEVEGALNPKTNLKNDINYVRYFVQYCTQDGYISKICMNFGSDNKLIWETHVYYSENYFKEQGMNIPEKYCEYNGAKYYEQSVSPKNTMEYNLTDEVIKIKNYGYEMKVAPDGSLVVSKGDVHMETIFTTGNVYILEP